MYFLSGPVQRFIFLGNIFLSFLAVDLFLGQCLTIFFKVSFLAVDFFLDQC